MSKNDHEFWPAHNVRNFAKYKYTSWDFSNVLFWEWNKRASLPNFTAEIMDTVSDSNKRLYFESLKGKINYDNE